MSNTYCQISNLCYSLPNASRKRTRLLAGFVVSGSFAIHSRRGHRYPGAVAEQDGADSERMLGVVEAIVAVRDQCPHAKVRDHALQALDAIKAGGAEVLHQQAFLVFSTLAGWRGPRALQVRRSLQAFLAEGEAPESAP